MISITLSRARSNMEAAKISGATLACLAGIAPSTLSAAFREQVHLDSLTELKLFETSLAVLRLQRSLRPLQAPTNVNELRQILDFIETNQTTEQQVRGALLSLFGIEQIS
jgi:hypothetical protein